ncbi:oxidative stress-induced growth inhibitor 1-like isoform X2 [Chrysoperla carnea]|nr:oxidative stress-induced growth inhibitor 1-like isoform X2 [Chrysoperla carnea]XP_044727289.1 oxidative stress-induced growth inhibitor 1-like isoform X2 [Chrysoperla carnea]XP_044727291.1 oxidative stress-induced growth inhibitor 1-like isoform X2 [Chrysoperla carnea]
MKNVNVQLSEDTTNIEYKDVVIIGNGPSGIALSYILDGNFPYYNQKPHPDELLTARLQYISHSKSLLEQDLDHLATGLEGRSANPVSLLVDALEHPNADLGYQHSSLLLWKHHTDKKIDHVVLGKGPPGGSWHFMDPHILTLSLGSWMALPGLPYPNNSTGTRTSAGNVAKYYLDYVKQQNLEKYFRNKTIITEIRMLKKCKRKLTTGTTDNNNALKDFNSNTTLNSSSTSDNCTDCMCTLKKSNRKCRLICCKCCQQTKYKRSASCIEDDDFNLYSDDDNNNDSGFFNSLPEKKKNFREVCSILDRSQSFTCDKRNYLNCTQFCYFKDNNIYENINNNNNNNNNNNSYCQLLRHRKTQKFNNEKTIMENEKNNCDYKWQITGFDCQLGQTFIYFAKAVVLATGSSDRPNRLGIDGEDENPEFILHNLRDLELAFDGMTDEERNVADPVLIVGAGLSAADAVIVARNRSLSVLHVFRRKNVGLDKQLPENMYPEYHKVHRMMSDTNGTYPLYTALPEHKLININSKTREITLENTKTGIYSTQKVSFIAILIGSRPNLNFLPKTINLGINKNSPIDCKTNPVDINPFTHKVLNTDGLYALGPLAGDNFVRFIPGGALATASDLFKTLHPDSINDDSDDESEISQDSGHSII